MFKAFYLSFFSKDFYRDIAANWRGPAFGLLFAAVTLHTLVTVVYYKQTYTLFLQNDAPALIEQIPSIVVLDGQVRIDKSWPYLIKTKEGKTLVHFDTRFDESKFHAGEVWVTGDTIHIRRNSYDEMRSYSLKSVQNYSVDKTIVQGWLENGRKWFLAALFPACLIAFFLLRMLQVGVYSLIGLFFNKTMHSYLTYEQIVRLCVAALIPVLVIDCFLMLIYPISWPWTGFYLAMGYLIFGIRANRELIR